MGLVVAIDMATQHVDGEHDVWACGLRQIAQAPHHQTVQNSEVSQRRDFELVKDEAGVHGRADGFCVGHAEVMENFHDLASLMQVQGALCTVTHDLHAQDGPGLAQVLHPEAVMQH